MSNAAALGIGVSIGFVMSIALSLWSVAGGFQRARGRTRAYVMLGLLAAVPIAVSAFMPTFPTALLVILGNAIGYALSHVVTLPMVYLLVKRRQAPKSTK